MWIKKVLSYLTPRQETKEIEPAVANLSPRVTAIAALDSLFPEQYSQYKVRNGEAVTMTSVYPNIEEYTNKLREAAIAIKYGRTIKPHWLPGPAKEIDVDGFLVSSTGFYLDNEQAVERFKNTALEFCEQLKKTEGQEFGVQEHNSRMLTKLLANLCVVSNALVEVSLMN